MGGGADQVPDRPTRWAYQHMCCLVLANAWVIWAGRRHERLSSAGVFYHPGPMAGAAAGMPKVVQVLDVINSDVDELDLRLGITEDDDIVVVVREAVQRARGVQKSKANEALAGNASENIGQVDQDLAVLRADLESAKEDLQRTHTELAAVKAEADRVSHALTAVKLDLEREGRTCKTL
jgi:hypothetical protein